MIKVFLQKIHVHWHKTAEWNLKYTYALSQLRLRRGAWVDHLFLVWQLLPWSSHLYRRWLLSVYQEKRLVIQGWPEHGYMSWHSSKLICSALISPACTSLITYSCALLAASGQTPSVAKISADSVFVGLPIGNDRVFGCYSTISKLDLWMAFKIWS